MASGLDFPSHLAPTLALLDAFNHRHRNQHRRSVWWQQFNLLRRAVRKLSSHRFDTGTSATLQKHVRRNLQTTDHGVGAGQGVGAPSLSLLHHIKWVMENVIPPSYIAFTQLAADNQYAPLGLALLGVLARFNSIISPILPSPFTVQSLPAAAHAKASTSHLSCRPDSPQPLHCAPTAQDLGVIVSRSEISSLVPHSGEATRKVATTKRDRTDATPTADVKTTLASSTLSVTSSKAQLEKNEQDQKEEEKGVGDRSR